MADRQFISVAELNRLLSYNPDTGIVSWKTHKVAAWVGKPVGCDIDRGYARFRINRKWQRVHRIAWALMRQEWPDHMVDHINGDRSDNRWSNLRASDPFLNQQNRIKAETGSRTGVLGVKPYKGRFCATIRVNNRSIWLGSYKSVEEASMAYLAAKRKYHPHSWLALPANSPRPLESLDSCGVSIGVGGTPP